MVRVIAKFYTCPKADAVRLLCRSHVCSTHKKKRGENNKDRKTASRCFFVDRPIGKLRASFLYTISEVTAAAIILS